MKTLLFTLSFFIAFTLKAQTLPIDSFYTTGATWVEYSTYLFGLGESEVDARSYTIVQDSVINGSTYHLVAMKRIGKMFINPAVPGPGSVTTYNATVTDLGIIGGIRVAGQQVYFIQLSPDSSVLANSQGFVLDTEKLIYDYSIVPGDSVAWQTYDITYGLKNKLQSTDSVDLTASIHAKRFEFDTSATSFSGANYWVEGIGSSHGMLGSHVIPDRPQCINTMLLCYTSSSFSYHFSSGLPYMVADSCFDLSALGVANVNKAPAVDICVYPNPVSGNSLFFEGKQLSNVTQVIITDMMGRQLQVIEHPFANGNRQIPIMREGSVYLMKIFFTDNTSCVKKIVRF